jgi:hypothetical protein
MNTVVLRQKAADEFRRELLPGEQVAVGSMVTSDPSRWSAAVLGMACLALAADGLLSLFGSLPGSPAVAVALPVLGLGFQFLPRPIYVVVTDRRLICTPMSRFRHRSSRPVIAVPLPDLRIMDYRHGRFGASIRCEIPGRKAIVLHWGRASRADFAEVEMVLARSGAFANVDPPYPPPMTC